MHKSVTAFLYCWWYNTVTEEHSFSLKSPSTRKCFFFLFIQLYVWASLCRMMYVQSLTLEGCFHIHLLKVESFSELIENLILRGGTPKITCDITTSFGSQSWSNMQLEQVWCVNLKPPVHKHWEWTLQWSRRYLVSRS